MGASYEALGDAHIAPSPTATDHPCRLNRSPRTIAAGRGPGAAAAAVVEVLEDPARHHRTADCHVGAQLAGVESGVSGGKLGDAGGGADVTGQSHGGGAEGCAGNDRPIGQQIRRRAGGGGAGTGGSSADGVGTGGRGRT